MVWFVFGQTAHFYWVRYDDGDYVYRSGHVTSGLSWRNAGWAFTHFHASNWHPLTTMSHMLDCQLFGVRPGPMHVVNVIIHSLAAITLFFALLSLTQKNWRSAFVAVVFAIHPLRAESVAWIAERKDVLSGLFFALTLLAYSAYARKQTVARYLLTLLFAALGLLSKSMLVTIPFVLLLLDFWPLARSKKKQVARLLLEKIPFALLAAGSAVGTLLAQHGTINKRGFSFLLRIENAIVACTIYLRQLFWPIKLAVLYPFPEKYFPISIITGSLLLLIVISASAVFFRKRFPFLLVGWLWFLGMLVPVLGLAQVGRQSYADRYTYLPLIGIVIAIVWLLAELGRHRRALKIFYAGAAAIICISLAACARRQTSFWQNPDTLWPHTLALTTNNDGAHLAFAASLFAEARTEEGIAHLRAAGKIRPSNLAASKTASIAQNKKKEIDAGLVFWSARVEQTPGDANAHATFGNLLVQKHQGRAAIGQWERALQLNPQDKTVQANLAWALATAPDPRLRDGERAVVLAQSILKAEEKNPFYVRTFAAAYAEAGQFDDAISAAQHAYELAQRSGNRSLINELVTALARYRQHLPFRDENLRPVDE